MQQIEQQAEPAVVQQPWETPELVKADVSEATLAAAAGAVDGLGNS